MKQRGERFVNALQSVVTRTGECPGGPEPLPSVSITELARRKRELPGAGVNLIVDFNDALSALPVQVHEEVRFRSDATYLVTGGLGGFGQKTAAWLVEHGARHLALVGRTGAESAERRKFVDELLQLGADVTCMACDISDEDKVKALFATLRESAFPLRGIPLGIDAVGGDGVSRLAELLTPDGTIVNYGMLSGQPMNIGCDQTIFRNINVKGFWLAQRMLRMSSAQSDELILEAVNLLSQNVIHAEIAGTWSLDEIGKAISRAEETGRHGKVCLLPNGPIAAA